MWSRIIIYYCLGFLTGVAVISVWPFLGLWLLLALLVVTLFSLLVSYPRFVPLAIFAVGFSIGVMRVQFMQLENNYASRLGLSINQLGRITSDPVRTKDREDLVILPEGESQKIKVSLFRNFSFAELGDTVWLKGELAEPKNFSDFDYQAYLQKQGVFAELKKPRVIVLERSGFSPQKLMIAVREYLSRVASKVYPEPVSNLVMGILLGQKRELPEAVKENFRVAGLSHIVAVSGYNMSIIAGLCGGLAWYLGRRWTNLLTIALVWTFVLLVGMSASVVRAAIMASLISLAQLLGRGYAGVYALLLVAVIMVLQNPLILIWDIGFQLSFAATFGVMTVSSIWFDRESSWIKSNALTTLGAIVLTAPIIAWHFGQLSLVAPLVNFFALPLIPPLMLMGALGFIPAAGQLPAIAATYLAQALLWISKLASAQTLATITPVLPKWFLILFFLGLVLILSLITHQHRRLSVTSENVKL